MKKNRMMRLASILLVCVLLTTSVISGTFAKYTTKIDSEDSARVAKWGFERSNSMDITDLFANAYKGTDDKDTVVGAEDADVIAPGTWGTTSFKFAYDESAGETPEVAYTFTVDTTGSAIVASIEDNDNIKWKLDDGEWGAWSDLLTAIRDLSGSTDGSGVKTYEPGELPDEFTADDDEHTIVWKWAFDDSDDAGFTAGDLDETDTDMGNANDLATVKLVIKITATQVD